MSGAGLRASGLLWVVGCLPPVPTLVATSDTTVTTAVCGDGVLAEGIEECDDGNAFGGDGCFACRLPVTRSITEAAAVLFGEQAGSRVGGDSAHVGVGDVDGDGFDDVLIGALGDDGGGKDAGAAYLFHGPLPPESNVAEADAVWRGLPGSALGLSVVGPGDVNGDGFGDVLIGAPRADPMGKGPSIGAAYLFHGPFAGQIALEAAAATFLGEAPGDVAGHALFAGDVTDDGVPDLGIGAHLSSPVGVRTGAAYVVHGPVTGVVSLAKADAAWFGAADEDEAAREALMGADLNGDGVGDLVVPVRLHDAGGLDWGAVYVIFGPIAGTADLGAADVQITGEADMDFAGVAVSASGDLDGDGNTDLVIGATRTDAGAEDAGGAYVFFGPLLAGRRSLSSADAAFLGEDVLDEAGVSATILGDRNGDGVDDLAVGAWFRDETGEDAGVAYVIHGPVRGVHSLAQADLRLTGVAAGDRLGDGVVPAGDVDGDGLADLLVGGSYHDGTGIDAGAVYLWTGERR